MTDLKGDVAFNAIRKAMIGETAAANFKCEDVPFERLRRGLLDHTLSQVDFALRLRHALRYADLNLTTDGSQRSLSLIGDRYGLSKIELNRFGLKLRPGGLVEAVAWCPDWLQSYDDHNGVDQSSMEAAPRKWTNAMPNADPWIKENLKYQHYRGAGQALAVRSALNLPSDRTLLVILPTGEGKSLIFHALACANPGKTVAVVVPTVSLAINHAEAVHDYPSRVPEKYHAYIGGENSRNEAIRSAIGHGEQGLVFAAPEAMVSGLRQPLLDAASAGTLAAIVIDEAHLVDAWGTDFRNEFQLLSALIEDIRRISSNHRIPNVVCLSATVTQESLGTLETLFSPHAPISIIPAARLRPEPDIWVSPVCSALARRHRVIEALSQLPRPAILYVTKVDDAKEWFITLRDQGFKRIEIVHGGTSTKDREKVIEGWRRGDVDLVIGTSAFGLGIDFAHVRTVIHACIPESLDRYYQEVGRSGRDNDSSIALIVPADVDFEIASGLASKTIIGIEKGYARWNSMFSSKIRDEKSNARYWIDPTVSPEYAMDMQSERNEDWNARVLTLMARAGLIRLAGMRYDSERKRGLIAVDILDGIHDHLEKNAWGKCVEPIRQRSYFASQRSLELMLQLIQQKECPSVLFSRLYGLNHDGISYPVVEACGGCNFCRKNQADGWFAKWPTPPIPPFSIGQLSPHLAVYFTNGRCYIERRTDDFISLTMKRRLKETVDRLWDCGMRKFILIGMAPPVLWDSLSSRPWCVVQKQSETILSSNGLPPGPECVWVANNCDLGADKFSQMESGGERIFFLPKEFQDPGNPGFLFRERRMLFDLDDFNDRLIS